MPDTDYAKGFKAGIDAAIRHHERSRQERIDSSRDAAEYGDKKASDAQAQAALWHRFAADELRNIEIMLSPHEPKEPH